MGLRNPCRCDDWYPVFHFDPEELFCFYTKRYGRGGIYGCNRFTAFIRILLPIAKPGVMVCAIFSFLYAWGDLAYGMTFIIDQQSRPITAGIFNFMGQYGTKWSYLTAFAVVTIIPVLLIFIFMQKYIVGGMTSGAVKG